MATEMKQRRDTAASWASKNEVLGDGVIGVVRETHAFKIGDGTTPWNSLPFSVISPQIFDAVGDLLVGTGSDSFEKLPTGTPGQRLTVDADGSLVWVTPAPPVPLAVFANEGDLIYGTGAGTLTTLPVGAVGTSLTVQADHSLAWQDLDLPLAMIDAAGDILVGSADNTVTKLAKGANGQVLTVNGSGALQWLTPSADIPLSTMVASGDLVVGAGAGSVAKLAKGANGQVLTVVAGVLTWANPSADIPLSTIVANGDLIVGTGAGAVSRLVVGSAGQFLGTAAGVPSWQDPPTKGRVVSAYATGNVVTAASAAEKNILSTAAGAIVAGRRYKVRVGFALIKSDNSADQAHMQLRVDTALTGTVIWDFWNVLWGASFVGPLAFFELDFLGAAANNFAPVNAPISLAAGNHSFHFSMIKNSGANSTTMTAVGTATQPTMLTIDDVGV